MMFAQRRNRLTTHFSERIPIVKRRMTVFYNSRHFQLYLHVFLQFNFYLTLKIVHFSETSGKFTSDHKSVTTLKKARKFSHNDEVYRETEFQNM